MASSFTKPYVDALFETVPLGDVTGLLDGLAQVADAIALSTDLRSILRNPAVDRKTRGAILEAIAVRAGLPVVGSRLLAILLQNGRIGSLRDVLVAVRERLDRESRAVEAALTTAAHVTATELDALRTALETRTGKTVRLSTATDPTLLGGFVVRVGSEVLDASLKHRLDKIKAAVHGAPAA